MQCAPPAQLSTAGAFLAGDTPPLANLFLLLQHSAGLAFLIGIQIKAGVLPNRDVRGGEVLKRREGEYKNEDDIDFIQENGSN